MSITITGMSTSWITMPGMAFVTAPAINAANPKAEPARPVHTNIAAPHTSLPAIMAIMREQ